MWEQINDYWQLIDSETGAVAEVRKLNTGFWLYKVESYQLKRKHKGMKHTEEEAKKNAQLQIALWHSV